MIEKKRFLPILMAVLMVFAMMPMTAGTVCADDVAGTAVSKSQTLTVEGEVIWDDDDDAVGARPESVTIRLLADGEETNLSPLEVTEGDGWRYSFGELPQYVDGAKVEYSVAEDPIADYDTEIIGFSVTNTYAPSGKDLVNVVGIVDWDDGNNRNGERPEKITVRLLADGTEVNVMEVRMGDFDFWLFNFDDYPIRDEEGQIIAYTVRVDEIDQYESEVTPSGDYAFRITITLVVPPELKRPAEIDTTPEPCDLTYNGENQSLVKAGSSTGGTVMYALGDDTGATPPKEEYSAGVPTGVEVGDYYVWYYVKGDVFHFDSEAAYVITHISKPKLTITAIDQTYTYTGQTQGEGDTAYKDPARIAEKVKVEGLQDGDTLSSIILDGQGTDVGTYELIPSNATVNGRSAEEKYNVAYVNGTLKIEAPTPAVSGTLLAKITAKGKSSLVLTWNKVSGAEGYDIFFIKCGKQAPKKVKTIKGNKTFKWTKANLKTKTPYKAVVKVYVMKNGKKTYVRTSPMVHAYTSGGTKNYTNAKSVTVKKTSVSLKAGKTYKIKATVNKLKKGKKLMPTGHAPKLRYVSSNEKIAIVSKSGRITAKSKGSCKVYVIAVNGARKTVNVTVR